VRAAVATHRYCRQRRRCTRWRCRSAPLVGCMPARPVCRRPAAITVPGTRQLGTQWQCTVLESGVSVCYFFAPQKKFAMGQPQLAWPHQTRKPEGRSKPAGTAYAQ